MNRFLVKIALLGLIAAASACIKGPEVAGKSAGQNGGGGGTSNARWPSANQALALKIADDGTAFTAGEITLIEQMGNKWEAAAINSNFFVYGRANNKEYADPYDYYDSEIGIYYHNNWFNPATYSSHGISSSALAVTQYFGYRNGDSFELVHGDILVNGTFFYSTIANTPNGQYDLPSVILHELGHLLGLGHVSGQLSVMRSSVSSGVNSNLRDLQTVDVNNIVSRYNLGGGAQTSALMSDTQALTAPGTGEHVRGVIELMADGKCIHKENGKVVHVHE